MSRAKNANEIGNRYKAQLINAATLAFAIILQENKINLRTDKSVLVIQNQIINFVSGLNKNLPKNNSINQLVDKQNALQEAFEQVFRKTLIKDGKLQSPIEGKGWKNKLKRNTQPKYREIFVKEMDQAIRDVALTDEKNKVCPAELQKGKSSRRHPHSQRSQKSGRRKHQEYNHTGDLPAHLGYVPSIRAVNKMVTDGREQQNQSQDAYKTDNGHSHSKHLQSRKSRRHDLQPHESTRVEQTQPLKQRKPAQHLDPKPDLVRRGTSRWRTGKLEIGPVVVRLDSRRNNHNHTKKLNAHPTDDRFYDYGELERVTSGRGIGSSPHSSNSERHYAPLPSERRSRRRQYSAPPLTIIPDDDDYGFLVEGPNGTIIPAYEQKLIEQETNQYASFGPRHSNVTTYTAAPARGQTSRHI